MKIDSLETRTIRISEKTTWIFVLIKAGNHTGLGEATLYGCEDEVIKSCHELARLINRDGLVKFNINAFDKLDQSLSAVNATALSAVEQAILDVSSQAKGVPLGRLLDIPNQESGTAFYANINRGVVDRTAAGWTAASISAAKMGFTHIKLAPFDGLNLVDCTNTEVDSALEHGLECIVAIRDALGSHVQLMIDCHARFDLHSAVRMLERVSDMSPYWIEEPLRETEESIPDILRFRKEANERNILVAGLEKLHGLDRFLPFIEAGAYDVILPDIRICGGVREFVKLANAIRANDITLSIHNPAGPVLNAISLQVARAIGGDLLLEYQYDESPTFQNIIATNENCWSAIPNLPPLTGPGLGLELATNVEWSSCKISEFTTDVK